MKTNLVKLMKPSPYSKANVKTNFLPAFCCILTKTLTLTNTNLDFQHLELLQNGYFTKVKTYFGWQKGFGPFILAHGQLQ